MRRSLCTALGACLLAVAGAGIAPAPATAASGYCTGTGINVVVDFGALGGGVEKGCAAGSGSRPAASAFVAAGVRISRVSRFPGAICKVEGQPSTSCTNMPPGDAYWGLFWSHGHGWTFSSQGVDSLTLAPGDTVAFAWQTSSRHVPATSPGAAGASAKPTSSGGGKKGSGSHSPAPSVVALPTSSSPSSPASTKASGKTHAHASTSASPSPSPRAATSSASGSEAYSSERTIQNDDSAKTDDSGGLPWWVPVGIVVVLAAGGAGAVAVRRRAGSGAG